MVRRIFDHANGISIVSAAWRASLWLAAVMLLAGSARAAETKPAAKNELRATYIGSMELDEEASPIFYPFGVFVDRTRDEVYVLDSKSRITIYNSNLIPVATIGRGSGVVCPASVAVDEAGNVYVAQSPGRGVNNGRITILDACLRPSRQVFFSGFPKAESFSPQRIAVMKDGRIVVTGSGVRGAVVMEPNGKQWLLDPTANYSEEAPNYSDVSVDDYGNLYLISEELGCIYVFNPQLQEIRHFGMKGGSAGKLSRPQGIAPDVRRGLFYVIDYMRHSLSVFGADGKYVAEFGGLGLGPGWFQFPKDCDVDSTGRVYVADTFNHRVQGLDMAMVPVVAQLVVKPGKGSFKGLPHIDSQPKQPQEDQVEAPSAPAEPTSSIPQAGDLPEIQETSLPTPPAATPSAPAEPTPSIPQAGELPEVQETPLPTPPTATPSAPAEPRSERPEGRPRLMSPVKPSPVEPSAPISSGSSEPPVSPSPIPPEASPSDPVIAPPPLTE
ncbi:MAG: NHL repeat-containing protein [Pseudomonadota bacterium]